MRNSFSRRLLSTSMVASIQSHILFGSTKYGIARKPKCSPSCWRTSPFETWLKVQRFEFFHWKPPIAQALQNEDSRIASNGHFHGG
jgi:hypothetical protein